MCTNLQHTETREINKIENTHGMDEGKALWRIGHYVKCTAHECNLMVWIKK